jgi:hypothetical protein
VRSFMNCLFSPSTVGMAWAWHDTSFDRLCTGILRHTTMAVEREECSRRLQFLH